MSPTIILGPLCLTMLTYLDPGSAKSAYSWNFHASGFDHDRTRLVGAGAEQLIRPGPGGLEIRLPGTNRRLRGYGVSTDFGIAGDFEITVSYRVLAVGRMDSVADVGVGLSVTRDGSDEASTAVGRRYRSREGEVYSVTMMKPAQGELKKSVKYFPAKDRSGKLRLSRRQSIVHYLAADGDSSVFRELYQFQYGEADVGTVRITADASGRSSPFAVSIGNLQIRTETLRPRTETRPPGRFRWMWLSICIGAAGLAGLAVRRRFLPR